MNLSTSISHLNVRTKLMVAKRLALLVCVWWLVSACRGLSASASLGGRGGWGGLSISTCLPVLTPFLTSHLYPT